MKTFAFVSDFDGTLTSRDFYKIIMDKYIKDGQGLYRQCKKNGKLGVEFLNMVFGSMNLTLSQLQEEILQIPLDPAARGFIEKVRENNGGFYIVSAGTSYYINRLLKHRGIDVSVISMEGSYRNGGIEILPDRSSPYYSPVFGIDKKRVLEDIKKKYDVVFFAGDSEPDYQAARAADWVFAKDELKEMLDREGLNSISFSDFSDVQCWMQEAGWLR